MRYAICILCMMVFSVTSATAQVSIGIGLPGLSIGINMPVYPAFVRVPNYPVYYAPGVSSNYFFYDGVYWVFQNDNWYASSWYNGPWTFVNPDAVPLFVLRIPVRYYRAPPTYFRGWQPDAPPRWGEHWGPQWEQHRRGWDQWNHSAVPAPAPLPTYQRQYSGDRYPRAEEQHILRNEKYRYAPRDPIGREIYQEQNRQGGPGPSQQKPAAVPQQRSPAQHGIQRSNPPGQSRQYSPGAPSDRSPQRQGASPQRPLQAPAPVQQRGPATPTPRAAPQPGPAQRQVPNSSPTPMPQGKGLKQGQGQGREKDDQRGQGRNQ